MFFYCITVVDKNSCVRCVFRFNKVSDAYRKLAQLRLQNPRKLYQLEIRV